MKGQSWLQWRKREWAVYQLGKEVVQLTARGSITIQEMHACYRLLDKALKPHDLVMGYDSLAFFSKLTHPSWVSRLLAAEGDASDSTLFPARQEIPICYEMGLDQRQVEKATGLTFSEWISIHQSKVYTVAFVGFMPGFIYTSGMDARLKVPKRSDPRPHVLGGSVAIGGDQTGIYTLPGPGGWQVIGRTPLVLFDPVRLPPLKVSPGDEIVFRAIDEQDFHTWER